MNYPVWDVAFDAGLLIAVVAIIHVFVSHFAVGGGLAITTVTRLPAATWVISLATSTLIQPWGVSKMRKYTVVLVVSVGLTVSGFAQRGGSHGNAGGDAGGGVSHMAGAGSEAGTSDAARGNSGLTTGSTANSMSKQSPETALTKSPQLASNLDKLLPTTST